MKKCRTTKTQEEFSVVLGASWTFILVLGLPPQLCLCLSPTVCRDFTRLCPVNKSSPLGQVIFGPINYSQGWSRVMPRTDD